MTDTVTDANKNFFPDLSLYGNISHKTIFLAAILGFKLFLSKILRNMTDTVTDARKPRRPLGPLQDPFFLFELCFYLLEQLQQSQLNLQ